MRNHSKYPPGWRKRAAEDRQRLGNKCADCHITHGQERLAYSGQFKPVYLQRHHIDGDIWNEHARLILLCPGCHFKRHMRSGVKPAWFIEKLKHRQLIALAYCV